MCDLEKKKQFTINQKKLNDSKLNKYNFVVNIPLEDKFNVDRGFFTTAWIRFKSNRFGVVSPEFNYLNVIESYRLEIEYDNLGTINYYREENDIEMLTIERNHTTLQSCLDELEKYRKEIVKHYSIIPIIK